MGGSKLSLSQLTFWTDWNLHTRLKEFIKCNLCGIYYTFKLPAYLLPKAISVGVLYFKDFPPPPFFLMNLYSTVVLFCKYIYVFSTNYTRTGCAREAGVLFIYLLKAFFFPRNLRICFLLKLTVCGFSGKLTWFTLDFLNNIFFLLK